MRVTLMHNPNAGDEEHSRERLTSVVRAAGHELHYQSVKDDEWSEALAMPTDLVVVAGGDGTIRKVFKELAGGAVPATLLPLGSANNVARTLGIADDETEVLVAGWPDGRRATYDIGVAAANRDETRFVESVGGGIFGEVLKRAEAEKRSPDGAAKIHQGLELLQEVADEARPVHWEIEVDGRDVSGQYVAVEVMNIREIGPNIPLAPEAESGDGLLDVALVPPELAGGLFAHAEGRRAGEAADRVELPVIRGRHVKMHPGDGCPLHVDDQVWSVEGELEIRGGADRVSLLVPATSP